MIGEGKMREEFEAFVLQWTGRDIDYHYRNQTGGMLFAWECWRQSATKSQISDIDGQFPAITTARDKVQS